ATVNGQLVLSDAHAASGKLPHLQVGLTHAAYQSAALAVGAPSTQQVDWQNDAKHYQYWAQGGEDGSFSIPNVRPGSYTLHAFADGVLGEFAKTEVVIGKAGPA